MATEKADMCRVLRHVLQDHCTVSNVAQPAKSSSCLCQRHYEEKRSAKSKSSEHFATLAGATQL